MTEKYRDRVVRVFISSTFRDMYAEREELVKYIFPELRRRCRDRSVEFVDVDLRWGVTEEQSSRGEVLPICLAEIERCHPYFVGLLGERYGWVPKKIYQEMIDEQPWLEEHKEKSVTELEILYGVLENPKMDQRSFFYFRDPAVSRQVEITISQDLGYTPEPISSKNKQYLLKERIKKSNYPVQIYKNIKTLGQQVLDDLWAAIEKQYPESEIPTQLEQSRLEHEAFAASRRKVYIGRQEYFDRLDDYVSRDGPPLVMLGESGSGKSALIANWVEQYRKSHPEDFVLLHFVGSTPDSTDYVKLLQRIILEIKARIEPEQTSMEESLGKFASLQQENEEKTFLDPKKVIEVFPQWLDKVAATCKFVLILDGLNQLADKDNAPDLTWLPKYIPPAIRLIVSTLPGRSLDALKKRNWRSMNIELLDNQEGREERKQIIRDYLKRFSKTLGVRQVERITNAKQTTNPLYLKTLLDELRIFGSYEKLNQSIEYYLQAKTIDALFDKMLERLEQDYERDRPGLTKDTMSQIWASRYGLSETELLEILNTPQVVWSPLKLAVEESLVSRAGLFNFFHEFLRQAVQKRYLSKSEEKKDAHKKLADYFSKVDLDNRQLDELPWQLLHSDSWKELKNYITTPTTFSKLYTDKKEYELFCYWNAIGKRFNIFNEYDRMISDNVESFKDGKELSYLLANLGGFFDLYGHYNEAISFSKKALAISEKINGSDHPTTAGFISNLAVCYYRKGDYDKAEEYHRKAMSIQSMFLGTDSPNVATTMNNLAKVLFEKGCISEAELLYRKAVSITSSRLGQNHPDTAQSLNNLAVLLAGKGNYGQAASILKRVISIREKMLGPNHHLIASSLSSLGGLLYDNDDYHGAELSLREALRIFQATIGLEHPGTIPCLMNLAEVLLHNGKKEEVEVLYRKALSVSESAYGMETPATLKQINALSGFLYKKGDLGESERLIRRGLLISEKLYGKEHENTLLIKDNLALLQDEKDKQKT